jgi:hypothetical protein
MLSTTTERFQRSACGEGLSKIATIAREIVITQAEIERAEARGADTEAFATRLFDLDVELSQLEPASVADTVNWLRLVGCADRCQEDTHDKSLQARIAWLVETFDVSDDGVLAL